MSESTPPQIWDPTMQLRWKDVRVLAMRRDQYGEALGWEETGEYTPQLQQAHRDSEEPIRAKY